jgi:hypothetical protein
MKEIKIAMTLHHHPHSPLQKNLWDGSEDSLLFLNSLGHASCRHPFWRGNLRRTGLVSTVTIITLHPIKGAIATNIIMHPIRCITVVDDGGGLELGSLQQKMVQLQRQRGHPRTSSSSESLRNIMLLSSGGLRSIHLRSPKSFLAISSSLEVSRKVSSSFEERSTTENPSEGSPCSCIRSGDPWDETSGEEADGGEDLVEEGGGIEASHKRASA